MEKQNSPLPLPDSREELETRPEALNLMSIYSGVSRQSVEQTLAEHAVSSSQILNRGSQNLISELEPIRKEFIRLKTDDISDQCLRRRTKPQKELSVLGRAKELVGLR